MVDARGRWALVTGASRGVGRQIALALAGQGCRLLLHARSPAHLGPLERELRGLGTEFLSFGAELSREESVRGMLREIDAAGVPVEFVWNNAGIQPPERPFIWDTPPEDYLAAFRVNVCAPAAICYHFLPQMLARGFGRIVNVTSGIAQKPELGAYATSKGALTKFTRDLAPRLDGTGVALHLTDPGWCRTDMAGSAAPNDVSASVPGVLVGGFVEGGSGGRLFAAQEYAGLSLAEAVSRAEANSSDRAGGIL